MSPGLRADLAAARNGRERLAATMLNLSRLPVVGKLVSVAFWVLCGADIPARTRIGAGLRLPHGGRGVVVHPRAVVGAGVVLYHGVTIGVRGVRAKGVDVPTIGDNVMIGTGAVILGGVTLGDGCRVGANSVVLCDVPAGATIVGNPGVIRGGVQ